MRLFNNPHCQHIHFIGIGGIGMCGLAEILLKKGYIISGSDQASSHITQRLNNLGARIVYGHDPLYVHQADAIVYSSAISEQNVELLAAREYGLPLFRRGEVLAELMDSKQGIAVAGTHGKTTTTGMISHILTNTLLDPITINGGILQGGETTVHYGQGGYLVAEADESDRSFLLLQPKIAVITNIEADHLENYAGNFEQLQRSFVEFSAVPADGAIICGIDDLVVRSLLPEFKGKVITFGFSEDADVRASQFQQTGACCSFWVEASGITGNRQWKLHVPGKHNVQNALAAIAVGLHLGVDETTIRQQLQSFPGMGRRFHLCGYLPVSNEIETVQVYTDYGHHPSEVAMTIAAARAVWPDHRLIMAFQPHRYSRTQLLMTDFVKVLATVDVLILLDIYGAGEEPILGINSEVLYQLLKSNGVNVHYFKDIEVMAKGLMQLIQVKDVIFLQGAGNIGTQGVQALSQFFCDRSLSA